MSAEPTVQTLNYPSLRRRMACWLYEGVLLFAVVFLAAYLFGAMTQQRHGLQQRSGLMLFLFVILGIYFAWFWHKGQTLAMKTWHLRVVGRDGQAISQGRALLRYLLAWLWFVPPLAAMAPFKLSGAEIAVLLTGWVVVYALLSRFHPQRQFVHDALAGTRLISHKPIGKTIPA
jgi:uncharacterized RDD family membrane protein YckC